MLVSVIIPAFNAARYIEHAIASVRAQRFRDFELIVVDDGSTDDTEQRAAAAAPDALVLRQPNGGPGKARNTGLRHARGRYVAFLDADDVWFPHMLTTVLAYARAYPELGFVHAERAQSGAPVRRLEPPRSRFCDVFHGRHAVPMGAVLVPRPWLEEVGGFDERRELHVEDWDLWLRIAARHPVGCVSRPVLWHRPGGLMSSALEKTWRGQLLLAEKLLPLCAEACPRARDDPARCARQRRCLSDTMYGRELLRTGRRHAARRVLAAAIAERPLSPRARLLHAASYLGDRSLERLYRVKDLFSRRL